MKLFEIASQSMLLPNEDLQREQLGNSKIPIVKKEIVKAPPSEEEKMMYQLAEGLQLQKDLEMVEKEKMEYIQKQQQKIKDLKEQLIERKEGKKNHFPKKIGLSKSLKKISHCILMYILT